ncbi:MAG: methyltransferase domain-containing protein [Planctomycetota bacterium]|nr:MAG: methyltransferase domain-containing protein [Planctomycetota bacterium]
MASEFVETVSNPSIPSLVQERYRQGAQSRQVELCCPVDYDRRYLQVLPPEILERDYGCGDPSKYLRPGERVLDLGSGGGKICFIASQVVGPKGSVIGVDMTEEMLELARRHQSEIAAKIGWDNVQFRRGRIEDLALDMDSLDAWLQRHPVRDLAGFQALQEKVERLRREQPMIPARSVDVIVSNCVLNLVETSAKHRLFGEMFRVLDSSGRAIISDIVCDRDIPQSMQQDPELWSGCISGAFREDLFLQAFLHAGFQGIEVLDRSAQAWKEVDGLQFRSLTVAAYKQAEPNTKGCC